MKQVMDNNRKANHKRLARFQTVDSRKNVDGVSAEDSKHPHVDVVKDADIHIDPEKFPEEKRHHDGSGAVIHIIDHQERSRGHGRQEHFVPPPQIKDVIGESEENHTADG